MSQIPRPSRFPLWLGLGAVLGGAAAVALALAGDGENARKAVGVSLVMGGFALALPAHRVIRTLFPRNS